MEVPLQVDVSEAARLFNTPGQAVLLDVREPNEYAYCHVEGSRHIPMGQFPARLDELPGDRHILVLFHHGGRSLRVTQFLRANNYQRVSNVAGGIDAWAKIVEPGLPRY